MPLEITKLPGKVRTVQTPLVKIAGEMQVLGFTVNKAVTLLVPHFPEDAWVAVMLLVPALRMVTVLLEMVATAVLLLV